jgi:formylglycine-generating enzyme required for sulfatase activity
MRRKFIFIPALAAILGICGLISFGVRAQTSKSTGKNAAAPAVSDPTAEHPYDWKSSFAKVPTGKVPRLPDGKPDLQGIWSFSTLTPLERRANQKNTEITAAAAEEAEDAAQKSAIQLRVEPTVTPAGEKTTDAYNSFWRDGYWYKVPMTTLHTSQVVDPPDGHIPPLTPEARERARISNAKLNRPAVGPEDRPTTSRCVTAVRAGPPIVGNGPGSQETTMQIIQGPDVVVVRQEALHASQMVYLDGRPRPAEDVHLDKGVSRGHWEGDTLVVDSTNFAPWGVGNFSAYGTTDKLHVIERWKRLDDTHLLYGFTVDDPGTWTKPWSVEYVMWRLTTQEELVEYACNEGNVGIHFTLTAAREREKAEAEAAAKEAAAQPEPGVDALAKAPAPPATVPFATNGLGMEFSQIPPGEFLMGCSVDAGDNECDKDEKPRHLVQITKPFEIQRTEVTQKLWQTLMGSNPAAHKGDVNYPVETVSYQDVQQFLGKLNAQNDGYLYRLPTEAEWEYAERAGTNDQYAWILEKTQGGDRGARGPLESRAVASQKPNGWGLYDTRGDVTEWVQDWYDPTYYSDSPKVDPKGPPTGELRVVRGGSFRGYARQVYPFLFRASVRTKFPEAYSFNDIGFRVAREKK